MPTITYPRRIASATRTSVALAALVLLPLQSFNGWTQTPPTAPAQTPLITRDGGQPSPNVMVTLDTSWSMIFPYLPEGGFTLNKARVNFPESTSPIMHPGDTRYTKTPSYRDMTLRSDGNGGTIPADVSDIAHVFQRQMRSPDVNRLYYNPRQLYEPWLKSKNAITGAVRYPAATPSQAWFDPDKTNSTAYADLTKSASKVTAFWCEQNPSPGDEYLVCGTGADPYQRIAYAKSFSPAVYFLLNAGANPTIVGSYTVYDINNPSAGTKFNKYPNRTDCNTDPCTQAEELQNYANWFVYHRTRLHTAQAAIPESFLQLDDNKIRVGWGSIHQKSSLVDGKNTAIVQSGVRDLDEDRKKALVTWIRNFRGSEDSADSANPKQPELASYTPLLSALEGVGEYFSRTDKRNPWVSNPALTAGDNSPPLTCRRSYNMLITDGYYNDSSNITNQDGTKGPAITNNIKKATPATYFYTPALPFSDYRAGTLADVAMKYWKNDLQPGIDNKVPYGNDTWLEDPAFWQHLVQFPIGLGVSGTIRLNDLDNQLKKLSTGAIGWWDGDANAAKIDDLLHAAINSRGQYFSAQNSSELVDALSTALGRAAARDGQKEGGVGVTSTLLGSSNNVKYVPEYTTASWVGDIKGYALSDNGVVLPSDPWSAASKVPAFGSRNIITWNGTAGEGFNWTTLSTGNQALITPTLPSGANGFKLVNFIRGDTSNEDVGGKVGLFRKRAGTLPDFINSNPLLIKGNVDLGYDKALAGSTVVPATYAQFVIGKAKRKPVLFVGGNGGMLHAFADYSAPGVVPGQEIFAYVPKAMLPKLGALALRTYGKAGNPHQYYVDGPLTETDAYLSGNWKNILLGTFGAGGKGLFALNVTDATNMGPTSILWEKSGADDVDMGYIFSAPQAGILANGDWAVFVGNGAHSTNGNAALFVINLSTGTISKLVVDAGGNNGLGGVTLVKNTNQQITGAYAGDLKGNVWRFTVNSSGTTATNLFTASHTSPTGGTSAQPITAPPAVLPQPNGSGGNLVVVGTGKLFDEGDNNDLSPQTVYGLWDKPTPSGNSAFDGVSDPRSKLVEQTIGSAITATGGVYFTVSSNPVDYANPNVLGWYIDLTNETGQRVTYAPIAIKDYVLISTISPAKAAAYCDAANGNGYNFLLPFSSGGGQKKIRLLDTDGDGAVSDGDLYVSGYLTLPDGGDTILTKPNDKNGGTDCSIQSTGGGQNCFIPTDPGPPVLGGKINGRVWRQILNPPHP